MPAVGYSPSAFFLTDSGRMRIPVIAFFIFAVAFGMRLVDLDTSVNVDAATVWFERSQVFWQQLFDARSLELPSGHPGMTLVWLSGGAMALHQLMGHLPTFAFVGHTRELLFAAKLPVAFISSISIALFFFAFATHTRSAGASLCAALFLLFDPLYLEHSKEFHLDALVASFGLLSVTFFGIYFFDHMRGAYIASAIFAALACATRSTAWIIPIFFIFILLCDRRRIAARITVRQIMLWAGVFFVTLFLIVPQLFLHPVEVFFKVFSDTTLSIFEPHAGTLRSPGDHFGRWYYPLFLASKIPIAYVLTTLLSFVVLAAVSFSFSRARGNAQRWLVYFGTFAVFSFLALIAASKQAGRYALPVFLSLDICMGIIAAFAINQLRQVSQRVRRAVYGLFGAILVAQSTVLADLHPYYQTYHTAVLDIACTGRFRTDPLCAYGWGEGFEVLPVFLLRHEEGTLPTVATVYPPEVLRVWYAGSVERWHADTNAEYVVLYKSYVERGFYPEVLRATEAVKPVHVVALNKVPYLWVYRTTDLP